MSDTFLISEKNSRDKYICVNSENELTFAIRGEKPEILLKNASRDFDVLCDANGNISVLAVSLSGLLYLLRLSGGKWEKATVLDSKSEGKKINGVRVIKLNGRLHAFYCIEYGGRMMLIHHIFDGLDSFCEPSVIDYVGTKCIFGICVDNDFNIHIVYAGENSNLKYTVFAYSKKRYDSFEVSTDDEIRAISCIYFKGGVAVSYLSREREYNVINCIRLDGGEKHTVGFGVDSVSEPCIFTDGKKIYIQWCEKGYAFECSGGNDFVFSRTKSIGQSSGILHIRCSSNEIVSGIERCAAGLTKKPLFSAAYALDALWQNPGKDDITQFENNVPDDFRYEMEKRLSDTESRVNELSKLVYSIYNSKKQYALNKNDIGEVDEENLEMYNSLDINSDIGGNDEEIEYNEIKEE